jgi:hypothetical protein
MNLYSANKMFQLWIWLNIPLHELIEFELMLHVFDDL